MDVKRVLISVSDKAGVVNFARDLQDMGASIISSGGTAKILKENKVECTEISEVTGFPEILGGRVKTLNPKIHGGILARRDINGHMDELKKHSIDPIDLVVVNLYPFEKTSRKLLSRKENDIPNDVIEDIDIGGVALLRAAAKNFQDVLVISDPSDYTTVLNKLRGEEVDLTLKRKLAAKAFRHTAYYDAMISGYFTLDKFPEQMSVPLKRLSSLRYGENPHQQAAVYVNTAEDEKPSVISAKQLQGKELSYNNYQDLESAWRLALDFDTTACAIIKHSNPCGCAQGENIMDAYKRALACDPVSAFGGIVAVNRGVDEELASEIIKLFTECVIAPSYTDKAKAVFSTKKNLRLLEQPITLSDKKSKIDIENRSLEGGMLVQDRDNSISNELKNATSRAPSDAEKKSLDFAWKVCKHVKSNAIILVRGQQTMGVGAGQMSRIDALKIAIEKMKEVKFKFDGDQPLVLASDAFFPFPDVVNEAAKIGVSAIIQPGGSIRDEDSVKAADGHNIAMIMTGMRHFRH